jgi:hypothetical protein
MKVLLNTALPEGKDKQFFSAYVAKETDYENRVCRNN